jgi:hypothetical protein
MAEELGADGFAADPVSAVDEGRKLVELPGPDRTG